MKNNSKGFTLIEILVTLAVSSLAMTAIYSTYMSQQKSYVVQTDIALMQQNLRAAMFLMTSELRMAGYDPSGNADARLDLVGSSASSVHFTKDDENDAGGGEFDEDLGDPGEDITYALNSGNLVRTDAHPTLGGTSIVADNIDALHLYYLDKNNDETGDEDDVRSIQITLVAKGDKYNPDYNVAFGYKDLQDGSHNFASDGYRRIALSTQVQCRNLGLQ